MSSGALSALPPLLREDPALIEAMGGVARVVAVPEAGRALVLAALSRVSSRGPILVAATTTAESERLAHDLAAYLGDAVMLFPAWETLPFERVSPSVTTMGQRLEVLRRLATFDGSQALVVVAPLRALLQRLAPGWRDASEPIEVELGARIDQELLVGALVAAGYRREPQVETRGELAVRGSIVDVFPVTAPAPVRIDLWGDEVDRLTEFAVADQRSTNDISAIQIASCRELRATPDVRASAAALVASDPWGREQWERLVEGAYFEGMESWLPWLVGAVDVSADGTANVVGDGGSVVTDLLGDNSLVVLVDPRRLRDRAAELLSEEDALASSLARTWGAPEGADQHWPRLHVEMDRVLGRSAAAVWSMASAPEGPDSVQIPIVSWSPVAGDPTRLSAQLTGLVRDGYRVVVAADGAGSAKRLADFLLEANLPAATVDHLDADQLRRPGIWITVCPLERGCIEPAARLAVLAESDLTGRRRAHRAQRARRSDARSIVDDLTPGDYVVHHQHGVGRYVGIVRRAIGAVERDYLMLEYRKGDKLYVPSDQVDAIRRYTGGDSPSLSGLGGGGSEWAKTKARVRAAVAGIAEELVRLYRERVSQAGFAFGADTPWQSEVEQAFPYVETPDQAQAILDVKADMESETPMDRLVCGDVGFGKTEVAIRAVFKAVQSGKQAAVVVPTTLLAQQHFQTFADRFAGYPIRVEVLSRFLTAAQARAVVRGVAEGVVDVVIGTHRLLGSDVAFKDLGLLVVDEEQRFGVSHKEALKHLKASVDVLTLTATPIPRTLEMSLTGIRDLSLLQTPPAARQPILTYVGEYDDRAVGEAIRRELLREGQAFFVHNRVQDIERIAAHVNELVPEARVAVAHGQMDEGSLEQVVLDFWEGRYDVLVCTTIIEAGIDMPTVNTLIVDRADRLGLGQLHQLRGRVGRAGQRAYAYLFFPPDREISETAYERLRTIGETTELGAGFRIAMRDLELRGAGNLLGNAQSGHIAAVGYDLYVQMVAEAVAELKGERVPPPAEITMDLPGAAYLPVDYVANEEQRLGAYRRLSTVRTLGEVDDIAQEWVDRFGPIPESGQRLLDAGRLRAECARLGVNEVAVGRGIARISPITLGVTAQVRLRRLAPQATFKEDLHVLVVPLRNADRAASELRDLLAELVPAQS